LHEGSPWTTSEDPRSGISNPQLHLSMQHQFMSVSGFMITSWTWLCFVLPATTHTTRMLHSQPLTPGGSLIYRSLDFELPTSPNDGLLLLQVNAKKDVDSVHAATGEHSASSQGADLQNPEEILVRPRDDSEGMRMQNKAVQRVHTVWSSFTGDFELYALQGGSGDVAAVLVVVSVVVLVMVGLLVLMDFRQQYVDSDGVSRGGRPGRRGQGLAMSTRPVPPPRGVHWNKGQSEVDRETFLAKTMPGRSLPGSANASQMPLATTPLNSPTGHMQMQGGQKLVPIERMSLAPISTPSPSNPPSILPHAASSRDVPMQGMVENTLRSPPALCPALVLPHCEAWFAVSIEKLMEGQGSFDVLGLSGNPLLRATIKGEPSIGRTVEISMTPSRSPTLASIGAPENPARQSGPPALEVRGTGGKHYGDLRPSGVGCFSLFTETHEVLQLSNDKSTGQLLLYIPADSNPIAKAARCVESTFFSGVEHLEVRVNPGVDAVLVLVCVLAVVLFGGGASLPSGRSVDKPGSMAALHS